MSVPSATGKVQYVLASATATLAIPFYFITNSHVRIVRRRDDEDETLASGFALSGAGSISGGECVLDGTQTAVGDIITIKRSVPMTQEFRYVPNDRFPASTHERALDMLTMQAQATREVAERGLLFSEGEVLNGENFLPPVLTRANKRLGFDTAGRVSMEDPIAVTVATGDVIELSTLAALKAVVVTALTTGRQARVSGYSSSGDGADGLFTYNSALSSTDNGGTIIAPNVGSGRWVRNFSGSMNVRWFGAKGDGLTDDATAIQAALDACEQYGSVLVPDGIFIVGAQLTMGTDNITFFGTGVIKAKDGVSFAHVIYSTGLTGVTIRGIDVDVNNAGRASVQATRYFGINMTASIDCAIIGVTVRNTRGYSSQSAVAIICSGGLRTLVDACRLIDCGENTTTLSSDGIFMRGVGCAITNCIAYRCKDTAFVLEGCNHSLIGNCVAIDCTSVGAISNDTTDDCVGNAIDGLTGTSSVVGSGGGLLQVACFGAGNLRQTSVSRVSIRTLDAATGLGAGISIRHTSTGRVIGLSVHQPTIDIGGAVAVLAQAIRIEDCDYVQITEPSIRNDFGGGSSCIRFDGASVGGRVSGGTLTGGTYGVQVKNTATVLLTHVNCVNQDDYGIFADDTSVVTSLFNVITGTGLVANQAKAAGATLTSIIYPTWSAWVPTYSSDIGNAATTFSGAVTTTLARYTIIGKIVHVAVNFSGTLNAVIPVNLRLTLPTGVVPVNDVTYSPAIVVNGATMEAGMTRLLSTGQIIFYRLNLAAFSSGAAVEGRVCLSFEMA